MKRLTLTLTLIVAGCSSNNTTPQADDVRVERTVAVEEAAAAILDGEANTEIALLDALWPAYRTEICTALNATVAAGLAENFVITFGVDQFEDSYGQQLTAPGELHFRRLLGGC